MSRARAVVGVALSAAVVAAGCSFGDDAGPCDGVVNESRATDWALHVLPNASVSYPGDPPTSGPHVAWDPPAVLDRPLSGPEQVGVLEAGRVLVQYRTTDIAAGDLSRLHADLPEGAVTAPNDTLDAPVVLTAFLTSQRCDGVDLDAVAEFAESYRSAVRLDETTD